jgi:hypothetical protein
MPDRKALRPSLTPLITRERRAVGLSIGRVGNPGVMMWWSKRSGERPRVRVLWWPLVLSVALSVGVTVLLNMGR